MNIITQNNGFNTNESEFYTQIDALQKVFKTPETKIVADINKDYKKQKEDELKIEQHEI